MRVAAPTRILDEREEFGEAVGKVKTVDKMIEAKEGRWCDHVDVVPNFVIARGVPNLFLRKGPAYIVIEEGKVKILCPECLAAAFRCVAGH